jgi:hypothetical protein
VHSERNIQESAQPTGSGRMTPLTSFTKTRTTASAAMDTTLQAMSGSEQEESQELGVGRGNQKNYNSPRPYLMRQPFPGRAPSRCRL